MDEDLEDHYQTTRLSTQYSGGGGDQGNGISKKVKPGGNKVLGSKTGSKACCDESGCQLF